MLDQTLEVSLFLIIVLEIIGARLRQKRKKKSVVPPPFQKVYDSFAHFST